MFKQKVFQNEITKNIRSVRQTKKSNKHELLRIFQAVYLFLKASWIIWGRNPLETHELAMHIPILSTP